MGIEAIKGAGMTYQGSTSSVAVKEEVQARVDAATNIAASDEIAADSRTFIPAQHAEE